MLAVIRTATAGQLYIVISAPKEKLGKLAFVKKAVQPSNDLVIGNGNGNGAKIGRENVREVAEVKVA
jgi:hypothetical protein